MTLPSTNTVPCLGVSQITRLLKELLESEFREVTVEGELTNFKAASSGHWYFSLKDEQAMISGVMFRAAQREGTFQPRDGLLVRVSGRVSVYEQRGSYQIIAHSLVQAGGIGELLARLEERKTRLAAEGLFDGQRKRPLPPCPGTIGLVTSATGAALHDMLRVFQKYDYSGTLRILPVPVQGQDAGRRIARMLDYAGKWKLADILILARGGGSLEDLASFSEEEVVRSVASCPLPVVSGIGHEVDTSLADLAADYRAATPTAAAEILARLFADSSKRPAELRESLGREIRRRLELARLLTRPFRTETLKDQFWRLLEPFYQQLDDAKEDLARAMDSFLLKRRHRLDISLRELQAHSPLDILKRGYAVIRNPETQEIIRSITELQPDQAVEITLHQGRARARIEETQP